MGSRRTVKLTVERFLAPEQIDEARRQSAFTTTQLHLLKQQIESLRRINCVLRAVRHKQRTGEDLPAAPSQLESFEGAGMVRVASRNELRVKERSTAKGKKSGDAAAGKKAGRGAKRGRGQDENEYEDESSSSGEEAAAEVEEEKELSESDDYETPVEDSDTEVAKLALETLASPGRKSVRQRKGPQSFKEAQSSSSDSGGSSGESDNGGDSDGGGGGGGSGRPRSGQGRGKASSGKSSGKRSPAKQQRQTYVVVKEDEVAGSGSIVLPELQPVPVDWATGDDALCSVCGDAEDADGNSMLLCDGRGCSVAVHQQCYGVAKVPKGKWLCDACKDKLSPTAANCACCPVVGGALRKVVSLGRVVPRTKPQHTYVHVACALWTPEMTLAQPEQMKGVQLEHMTALRAELQCALCKQTGGAVVQCCFSNCCRSFHVLCGRAAGQLLTFRETDGEPLAFCGLHSGERFRRSRDAMVEGRTAEEEEEEEGAEGQEEEDAAGPAAASEPQTEYELARQRNIERNKQMLAAIRAQQ